LFIDNDFSAVIHFAGLKAVGESVEKPLEYYDNNITGTLCLLEVMGKHNVKTIIFSSSACVYGDPDSVPIKETAALRPTNPYGQTKAMIEKILEDLAVTNTGWKITTLRYFNPMGANKSGLIGEDPNGIPNNLVPYISQVAVGKLDKLHLFGDDYNTPDGTCVRDFIHVVDLAKAHIAVLENGGEVNECRVFNVGTSRGTSVLEMIAAFKKASGKEIPYVVDGRRPGDIAECYADCSKIYKEIGWKAELNIEEACRDAWNWQSRNPLGFK
jgi:UDP-glucose 4-epimerase